MLRTVLNPGKNKGISVSDSDLLKLSQVCEAFTLLPCALSGSYDSSIPTLLYHCY